MSLSEIFASMDYGKAPESAELARTWLQQRHARIELFIDNRWQPSSSDSWFETQAPASGEMLAQVAEAGVRDVNRAVNAANRALPAWSALDNHERARHLYAIARQIQKHSRLFAVLESLDNGKPIRESRDIDIPLVVRHFYHHAGWAQLKDRQLSTYRAVGVVGQIIPWNFPLLMLAWKIAPAIAMGNTVVLKPAEYTPLTAALFAQVCKEAGLPRGVVNVVFGAGETGAALVKHGKIQKIAFTGSTEVGQQIRKAVAGSGKKLSLELGGKSAFLVFDDADIDSAVEGLVDAIWFNQGQVCCAGSRLLVQESIADTLIGKVKRRMQKLALGDSLDKNIDIGAVVSPVQLKTIKSLVKQGLEEGGELWQPEGKLPGKGSFYPPSLITGVAPASTLAQVEIFGPVLVCMTFRTPVEAVRVANNSRYGLAASIWSENINLALDIAPKLKAGTVWINCTNVFDAASGFGGYRESGFGREGGKEGLYEYLRPQWQDDLTQEPAYHLPSRPRVSSSNVPSPIDRTPKLYIAGKQQRPDSGYSVPAHDVRNRIIAELPAGNRKDVRNAVEAASKAVEWTSAPAHNRAQVMYYIAENLAVRQTEFANRLSILSGATTNNSLREIGACISRLYTYAAVTDKYDGDIHATPLRNVTLAMKEPLGVLAIMAPEEAGFIGFISTLAPALAMGNRIVIVPSRRYALLATDFYQVLDTSDVPSGSINIITGDRDELTDTLARHLDVDGFWYWGTKEGSRLVEYEAAANMKRTWVNYGKYHDWFDDEQGAAEEFLRRAVEIKNIWVPYGA